MNAHAWGRNDTRRLSTRDFPAAVLDLVEARDGGRFCVECRRLGREPSGPLQVDHKQPLSHGGTNHWTNLQWLCQRCNCARGNRRKVPAR